MPESPNDPFKAERNETLNRIISIIDNRIATLSPALITGIHDMSSTTTWQGAARETWMLLRAGIRHLKDGGPGGQPGLMTTALSKASLRSSSLAASLGMKPPQFEQTYYAVGYTDGYGQALFLCKLFLESAEGDISKSRQLLRKKIDNENMADAFGVLSGVNDPALKNIFEAIRQSADMPPPPGVVSNEDLLALKKQAVISLELLLDNYTQACQLLRQDLETLPPKPPAHKGQPFKL